MNGMGQFLSLVLCTVICSVVMGARDETRDLSIIGCSTDGRIYWSNTVSEAVEYRVQSAALDRLGDWTDEQLSIAPAGSVMSARISPAPTPRVYRVQAITSVIQTSYDYLVIDLSSGSASTNYPITYLTNIPTGGWTDTYKTTKLVLRRISADAFLMGSGTDELRHDFDEPQHSVTLTHDFYLGVFELTQKQWERVMGTWPSYFRNPTYRDARPVELVSFDAIRGPIAGTNWPASGSVDTNSFMGRLRARTGLSFDLPTEAQWEYAGRAGTSTALNSGHNLDDEELCTVMSDVGRYWYDGGASFTQNGSTNVATAKVGSFLANDWGLYDIHGNVWEWCLDWYEFYPAGATDPTGPSSGLARVIRGGSWSRNATDCRAASRFYEYPGSAFYGIGFRVGLPASP